MLTINVNDSRADIKKFMTGNPYPYLYGIRDSTGDIGNAYRIQAIPTTYIVDQKGVIRFAEVGYSSEINDRLKKTLDALLAK